MLLLLKKKEIILELHQILLDLADSKVGSDGLERRFALKNRLNLAVTGAKISLGLSNESHA